jgi:hypothetical protein
MEFVRVETVADTNCRFRVSSFGFRVFQWCLEAHAGLQRLAIYFFK